MRYADYAISLFSMPIFAITLLPMMRYDDAMILMRHFRC